MALASIFGTTALTSPLLAMGGAVWWDVRYFIYVGPAILLALYAQAKVRGAMHRWSGEPLARGLTGEAVARRVLELGEADGVGIELSRGWMSDHYDPRTKTLRLSEQNYHGRSVAAAAVAAHEAGHAIQHARRYAPLELRSLYVPVASIGSGLSLPLILVGAIFSSPPLVWAGIILFSAVVLFQLITLPVEFDASRRAKRILIDGGVVTSEHEAKGVSAVLNAAALTYVAATVQAILTLIYYLSILRRN